LFFQFEYNSNLLPTKDFLQQIYPPSSTGFNLSRVETKLENLWLFHDVQVEKNSIKFLNLPEEKFTQLQKQQTNPMIEDPEQKVVLFQFLNVKKFTCTLQLV
jgi:hypothetical protein